eukprot:COSAG02_NODE_3451_length_6715_cov_7.265146_1_plen_170_part_00
MFSEIYAVLVWLALFCLRWSWSVVILLLLGTCFHMAVRRMRPMDAMCATAAVMCVGCMAVVVPAGAVYSSAQHVVDAASGETSARTGLLGTWSRAGWLQLYLLSEAAFVGVYFIRRQQLQRLSAPAELQPQARMLLLDRALSSTADAKTLVSGWFKGALDRLICIHWGC